MRKFIYARMALTNIRKNSKIYFPYILTCIGAIAMFYIMYALAHEEGLQTLYGGAQLGLILSFAMVILGFFSAIFLFYTHSFLIKRRKKEFGIYNILGMEKKHISKMMCLETIFTALIGMGVGLFSGIILSKLFYLLLLTLLNTSQLIPGGFPEISLTFSLSSKAVSTTVILFAVIFLLSLLNTLRQIHLSNPIELLHGSEAGEREPKVKWPLVLVGLVTLGAGYFIAVTTDDIFSALPLFTVAVLLVIIGTYCLFTAGSIAVLKLLRKNKHYYYKAKHFTNVSGMLYRMKQNAVGLSNICILSTAVLVTLSTTISLYIGLADLLHTRFPRNIALNFTHEISNEDCAKIDGEIAAILGQYHQTEQNPIHMRQTSLTCLQHDNIFSKVPDTEDYEANALCNLYFISLDDYKKTSKDTSAVLADNEVIIQTIYGDISSDSIKLGDNSYRVIKNADNIAAAESQHAMMLNSHYIVMSSEEAIKTVYKTLAPSYLIEDYGDNPFGYYYAFDLSCDDELQKQISGALSSLIAGDSSYTGYIESAADSKADFYALYGSILFIGIFIGLLFIMATVLIIYYKQISEGYEDRARYAIMQKVGMSLKEVRRSIKSQVLTVFFLPLGVACVHLIFAFPLMTNILKAMNLTNTMLYAFGCVGTVIVFALFYSAVYGLTARTYYKIVSGK